MYIHIQFQVVDEDGVIRCGSASVITSQYDKHKYEANKRGNHQGLTRVESLGTIVYMRNDDRTCGIFDSPTRGLIFYDLTINSFSKVDPRDPRLKGSKFEIKEPMTYVNFGRPFLFTTLMFDSPVLKALRACAPDEVFLQRMMAHLTHGILSNGEFIKCGDFLERNILSHVLSGFGHGRLNCDSEFFFTLSDDRIKVKFFRTLAEEMRKIYPDYGKHCHMDTSPLPGEAKNNPYNAMCSHGTDGAVMQSRISVMQDDFTGMPLWFNTFTSTILDKQTTEQMLRDIRELIGIEIESLDLDAGYCIESLFKRYNIDNFTYVDSNGVTREHSVLVRMTSTKGYPTDDLYIRSKPDFYNVDYQFDYEGHTFFGKRFEIELFGNKEYAYVYVDKYQAMTLGCKWRCEHPEEWESLSLSAKEWKNVDCGYFILVGNRLMTPKEAVIEYRSRTSIEGFFRDSKTFLRLLPLNKWTKERVTGKIFMDVVETMVYRELRKLIVPTGKTMRSLMVAMNGWQCSVCGGKIYIDNPAKAIRECIEKLGYTVPVILELEDLRREVLKGIAMERKPAPVHRHRPVTQTDPISPEEKREAEAKKRAEREQRETEQTEARAKKAEQEAQAARAKAEQDAQEAHTWADKEAQAAREKAGQEAQAAREQGEQKAQKARTEKQAQKARAKAEEKASKAFEQAKEKADKAFKKAEEKASKAYAQAEEKADKAFRKAEKWASTSLEFGELKAQRAEEKAQKLRAKLQLSSGVSERVDEIDEIDELAS